MVADLFLFCYERDFMMSLSDDKQADVIDAFNTTSRYLDDILNINNAYFDNMVKVSKGTKIRNRYNQVPHLTQDTNWKVTNLQLDTTNESQEVSPFQAGDHEAHINRQPQRHSKHKTENNIKDPQRRTALERSVKYLTGGLKPVKYTLQNSNLIKLIPLIPKPHFSLLRQGLSEPDF